jgi:hypothetical protein
LAATRQKNIRFESGLSPPPAANSGNIKPTFVPQTLDLIPSPPNAMIGTAQLTLMVEPLSRSGNSSVNVIVNTRPPAPLTRLADTPVQVLVKCFCSEMGDFQQSIGDFKEIEVKPPGGRQPSMLGSFVVTFMATSGGTNPRFTISNVVDGTNRAVIGRVENVTDWGFSPEDKFLVVTQRDPVSPSDQLFVYDLAPSGTQPGDPIISLPGVSAWGFGPQEKAFVTAKMQSGLISVEAYDLKPGGPARLLAQTTLTTCVPMDPNCMLPQTQQRSFCVGGANDCLSPTGKKTSDLKVGLATWGFSPDDKSLLVAFVNPNVSASQVTLQLFDLTGSTFASTPVFSHQITGAALWRFSPCGDMLQIFEQSQLQISTKFWQLDPGRSVSLTPYQAFTHPPGLLTAKVYPSNSIMASTVRTPYAVRLEDRQTGAILTDVNNPFPSPQCRKR